MKHQNILFMENSESSCDIIDSNRAFGNVPYTAEPYSRGVFPPSDCCNKSDTEHSQGADIRF